MILDFPSFASGFIGCACLSGAYFYGQHRMVRLMRRIARHGRDFDHVFFEDAERDAAIERPKPIGHRAELHVIDERQSGK